MENKTRSSNASATTPSTLCDSGNHLPGHTSDSLRNDTPEQLLTPENSRSETSSNNESAPNYEKPTFRRTSTRATRASLRNTKQLGDAESKNNAETPRFIEAKRNGSDEAIVKNVCDENKTQPPALRHSMVIMELPQLSKNTLNCGNVESEDRLVAPDTPVSNLSHNQLAEDTSISIQQRASRKRVESALVKQDTHASEKSSTTKLARREPLRRSSRLSLPGRKSNFLDRLSTVLGKRPRDKIENEKESGRRASLRPRKAKNPGEEPASATPSAVASVKRRRVSESDIPSDPRSKDVGENPVKPLASTPKRWLTEGLYIGQEPTDAPPSQNRNKGTRAGRRKSTIIQQRRFLPLPMFAGARLLNNGRDFKLPFDVFSPVPPGQPKPDEWRKTNKSMCSYCTQTEEQQLIFGIDVFVGEAGSIWRANKPLELSKCLCTEETGCDENCQNRYMFYECDDGNCGLGRECGNRSFEELKQRTKAGGKYNIGVEVIKTSDRGYGVRSNRTFEPNQIIVEYTGEIITQTECERRMRTIYKSNEVCASKNPING
ncbi:Histone-lysine N-methyltransferase [Aspergillus sclerotialis]|uniref:Histone-lysine N-methyltransferase n=1 Tax=Aspergillus sclerotialis TaxID=2070753 RepID=A0A3A2ZLM7_9EURO|nr:Histone-lysine N-methyltransferase [Aspergillus sclerotialis]